MGKSRKKKKKKLAMAAQVVEPTLIVCVQIFLPHSCPEEFVLIIVIIINFTLNQTTADYYKRVYSPAVISPPGANCTVGMLK